MIMTDRAPSTTAVGVLGALAVALVLGSVPAMAAKAPTRAPRPDRSFSIRTGELTEASGCAVSRRTPNLVWLHNDSGAKARLFSVNVATRAVRVVNVGGAEAVDWEDMTVLANGDLLIADIGDNAKQRNNVTLYQVPEPSATAKTVAATSRTLQYADGPHNAEALVVDPVDGTPYVITKEASGVAGVYVAEGSGLRDVGTITIDTESFLFPNMITGADALPDGSGIVLRTYQSGYVLRRPAGKPFVATFAVKPKSFALPFMLQAEAICALRDSKSIFTTSESRGGATIPMAIVSLP